MDLYFSRLDNGIRMVHYPTKGTVAYCGLIIGAGSRDEGPDENGLAHFIEHMLFKGTSRRKAYHIISYLEDVGGELNAYTTKEETSVYATVLREHYSRAVGLLSDIVFGSLFPAREIEKEKEVVAEEISSCLDNPSELIFDEFDSVVFPGEPIGRSILGTPASVKSFNAEKIREFIASNYDTSRMVFCSVGDISVREAERHFRRNFEKIEANYCGALKRVRPVYNIKREIRTNGTNQAHCIIGNEAYAVYDKKRPAMYLLNNIIGGEGLNSRLNMSLREKNGYVYNVESNYYPFSDTGLFTIYFGTDERNLNKSLSVTEREMKRLMTKRLGPVQITRARNQLKGYLARSYENHEHLMLTFGKSLLLFDKIEPAQVLFERIDSISADHLMEVANEVFRPESMSRLVYR